MNEEDAEAWIRDRFGDEVHARIADFVAAVVAETEHQNLIAKSTLDAIWWRHVIDSAQLIGLADRRDGLWIDIGTGAGFPGMVVALTRRTPTVLIEPRRKRAAFLSAYAAERGAATYVTVVAEKAERVAHPAWKAAVISARAVASVGEILAMSQHLGDLDTQYLLHRGRSVDDELEKTAAGWHGMFHVERSVTDPESGIIVATQVRPR